MLPPMDAAIAGFARLIDYAGLYPPAGLALDVVVRNYGAYRAGSHDWMLGRLILPADRLVEANALATASGATPASRWPVSVLVGGPDAIEASRQHAFRARDREDSVLAVESIEASAGTEADIEAIARAWPADLERFVELPPDADPDLMRALAAAGCLAKIRTGGVTPDRFPTTGVVARFMAAALAAGIAMKATAGLHHAIRGTRPMTYAPDSATTVMHGFANLVFAAALLATGKIDAELADALLDDDRPEVFRFGGRAGSWLNAVLTYGELAEGRRRLLRSVGSCSFDEPVNEAKALDWIA
jgi:hypothetical protein